MPLSVAGDFDLRNFWRDQPGVERIARKVLRAETLTPQDSKETILT
jgi:hypothetical protein